MVGGLSASVFKVITDRFALRARDIARFTATKYSFEEWLNWEAFSACSKAGWQVYPKPPYSEWTHKQSKQQGDLLVTDRKDKVLVEIGLIHDDTQRGKWRAKLDGDTEKIARPMHGITPLQIIVVASARSIDRQRWLVKIRCWNRPTPLSAKMSLAPHGQIVIKGWVRVKGRSRARHTAG